MRILFVVQRYGADIPGGAEAHCRAFATRLAARGHDVGVVTAAEGPEDSAAMEDGVGVRRLARLRPVDTGRFGPFTEAAIVGAHPPAALTQDLWLRAQGPVIPELESWLAAYAGAYDVAVFFTYLFRTFWSGLAVTAGRVPTVAHATAHDEPYFWLPALTPALRRPDAYAWSTEEERDLLRRRGDGQRPGMVIGIGVEPPADPDPDRFRQGVSGLGHRPYLLYLGRINEGKGVDELYRWFVAYKRRRPGSLALVLAGNQEIDLPDHGDVTFAGYLDETARNDALAGTVALVQPSRFESFSMVLTEAWANGRPAIVQGASDVLAGQGRRAGGAIAYHGYGEFEAAVDAITGDPDLGDELGRAGLRYVTEHYDWNVVLDRYERLLVLAGRLAAERGRFALDA